jgi:hypothetical protein
LDDDESITGEDSNNAQAKEEPILVKWRGQYYIFGKQYGNWQTTQALELSVKQRQTLLMLFMNEEVIQNTDPRFTTGVREILRMGHEGVFGSEIGISCGIIRSGVGLEGAMTRARSAQMGASHAVRDLAAISRLCEVSIEKMAKLTYERLNPASTLEPE